MQNNNSNKKNIEIFLKENARDEDKDGKSGDGWMFLEKVLKEGSVSNDFSGLKSINNSYEMVIRFEFRNKKWLFIQCSVAEGA